MTNYAALGVRPPPDGFILHLDEDPDFEARWHLTVYLKPALNVSEIRRFGSRWAGITTIGLRPWVADGPSASGFCIVSGEVWVRGKPISEWDRFWEYPTFEAARSALFRWNGEGEPANFIATGIER